MANWASTSYAIEGPKETLQRIYNAIQHHPVEEDSSDAWEGNVLAALGIEWERRELNSETLKPSGYYMRGFISDDPWWDDNESLRFDAEEAWGVTDFYVVLEKNLPDIKVFYVVEEPGEGIYATNDKEGKYFPDRYYVDTCINDNYQSEYFIEEKRVYEWLSYLTYGKVRTPEDVDSFNDKADEEISDDFIYVHEFKIVE